MARLWAKDAAKAAVILAAGLAALWHFAPWAFWGLVEAAHNVATGTSPQTTMGYLADQSDIIVGCTQNFSEATCDFVIHGGYMRAADRAGGAFPVEAAHMTAYMTNRMAWHMSPTASAAENQACDGSRLAAYDAWRRSLDSRYADGEAYMTVVDWSEPWARCLFAGVAWPPVDQYVFVFWRGGRVVGTASCYQIDVPNPICNMRVHLHGARRIFLFGPFPARNLSRVITQIPKIMTEFWSLTETSPQPEHSGWQVLFVPIRLDPKARMAIDYMENSLKWD